MLWHDASICMDTPELSDADASPRAPSFIPAPGSSVRMDGPRQMLTHRRQALRQAWASAGPVEGPDAHQRALISNPTVCSGTVPSLSLRVACTPKETAGAPAAGVSRQPSV